MKLLVLNCLCCYNALNLSPFGSQLDAFSENFAKWAGSLNLRETVEPQVFPTSAFFYMH